MVDVLTKTQRSFCMSKIRGKNTIPEMIVRKFVHSLGFRYRIHRKDIPGTPDLAFVSKKKLIFVHGCFWHRHAGCRYAYNPKSNVEKWQKKFITNVNRDNIVMSQLEKENWSVLIIWECETKNLEKLNEKIHLFLN